MTTSPDIPAPVISATGLFTPANSISNAELVESYNRYVDLHNAAQADAIAAGDIAALEKSSAEFIEKASGIKSRYVLSKAPILDPDIMCPQLPERGNDDISILAEIGVAAARQALDNGRPRCRKTSMPCCAPAPTCSAPIRRLR